MPPLLSPPGNFKGLGGCREPGMGDKEQVAASYAPQSPSLFSSTGNALSLPSSPFPTPVTPASCSSLQGCLCPPPHWLPASPCLGSTRPRGRGGTPYTPPPPFRTPLAQLPPSVLSQTGRPLLVGVPWVSRPRSSRGPRALAFCCPASAPHVWEERFRLNQRLNK